MVGTESMGAHNFLALPPCPSKYLFVGILRGSEGVRKRTALLRCSAPLAPMAQSRGSIYLWRGQQAGRERSVAMAVVRGIRRVGDDSPASPPRIERFGGEG
jgi:hypothetical protein